ncbi:ABC transporter, ATP-binding protein [Slackia sp. CM382]|uniref:ABC transporter ATP-binding protein n=1 Tax=Slackia sp. CM382 TaxID=1111137 RepID=UPI00027C4D32|nr:ABC transporter ATP-binding protein [Slackia sp. CM382]EJU32171.1 ABC transporter, ATP-binding protein [Slackia sp. CM382]
MNSSVSIALDKVTFQYSGRADAAIQGVDLDIHEGEFVLLTGRSGCGKTTVARLINGLAPHFYEGSPEGAIRIGETDTRDLDIGEIGKLVGSVFQDPRSQFFMTDTTSEVAFGCVNAGLPRAEVLERVEGAFRRMGIQHLRDRSVFGLSSGEMQMVAIASCYAMGPSVYVFDEPSANLDMEAVETLRRAMSELKREGKTVIVLEHRLFYLSSLIDRMVVIEGGAVSRVYDAASLLSLDDASLARMGLRSLRLESALQTIPAHNQLPPKHEGTTFEVKDLVFSYSSRRTAGSSEGAPRGSCTLGPLSFSAQPGEVIGIIGENGAGKTTLSRLCCGLEKENQGTVSVAGEVLSPKGRLGRVRLIMQDPNCQLFSDSVLGELSVGGRRDTGACERALKELGLWDMRGAHPATLSRGQKQRLTIACALVDESAVYFFDEPTSGLDRENMEKVASAIKSLARSESIVFTVSHDFEFLLSTCNRILHLKDGLIVDDFALDGSTRERLLRSLWKGGAQWSAHADA